MSPPRNGLMVMCSIFDSVASAWMTPMFFQSKPQALRSWGDAVNNPESDFAKHPADYSLMYLGTWDPMSGVVDLAPAPENLGSGANFYRGGDA